MQQRVALARALAIEPRVLLLDEPLSALDAKVRVQLREEIRRLQTELGITTIYVTHDQEEALSVSDRVAVMKDGRIEQIGPPAAIYGEPETPFVAEFIGTDQPDRGDRRRPGRGASASARRCFRLPTLRAAARPGERILVLVRPETVVVARRCNGGSVHVDPARCSRPDVPRRDDADPARDRARRAGRGRPQRPGARPPPARRSRSASRRRARACCARVARWLAEQAALRARRARPRSRPRPRGGGAASSR